MAQERNQSDDSIPREFDHLIMNPAAAVPAAWLEQVEAESIQLRDEIERLQMSVASRERQLAELNSYVDDRKRHWAELQEELAYYQGSGQTETTPGLSGEYDSSSEHSLDCAMSINADGSATGYPALKLFDIEPTAGALAEEISETDGNLDQEAKERHPDQAPTRQRKLLPLHNPDGVEYPISAARVTIGRSRRCEIRIPDDVVSRRHAQLFETDDCVFIEDYESTNGILVNDERVHRSELHHGDIVNLGGRYELRYVEEIYEL